MAAREREEVEAARHERLRDPKTADDHANREALERWAERRRPVVAKAERGEDGRLALGSRDGDTASLAVRLADAVGTGSTAFALRQLDRLAGMIPDDNDQPERALNAMLAAVEGIRPETEAEGMLAVQMAATHEAAMTCLARLAHAGTTQTLDITQNAANKLMRTFVMQAEALSKLRRGGEQTVRVEHVHVYQGGQAIVGNVEHRGGGYEKNGHQAHAPLDPRSLAFAPVEPLLRDDASGDGVPVACREGQGAVPDARRGEGERGSEG